MIKEIINDTDFQQYVLDAVKPVIVDFYATWCSACKVASTALEITDAEFQGHLQCVKVNVEGKSCDDIPVKFGISKLPTLLVFWQGRVVDEIQNPTSLQLIARQVQTLLHTGSIQ